MEKEEKGALEKYLKELEKLSKERMKSVKKGNNVIHLQYLGGIEQNIIELISDKLKSKNIEFSYFDSSGFPKNDYIEATNTLIFSYVFISEYLTGISQNAVWDVIRFVVLKIFNAVKNKKYQQ